MSFVFGLLGFFGLGALGWGTAIVLSKSGINNIDKEPNKYKGRGFAVAGEVLGTNWVNFNRNSSCIALNIISYVPLI